MITNRKLALVTPVKNEIGNLPDLFNAVEKQSTPVALWIILDDASTDGSAEFLKKRVESVANVKAVRLFHLSQFHKEYRLGSKYSQIIAHGLERVREYETEHGAAFDFIGILDSDCFPCPDYYKKLLEKFALLPRLGIASGVTYYLKNNVKQYDRMPLRWARGGVRVWRAACLSEAGYMIGNSADAISSAKAWVAGWQSQAFPDSWVDTREMGARINAQYYGEAAYYLYTPSYYLYLKCIVMVLRYGWNQMTTYLNGYRNARLKKNRIQVDKKVIWYFRLLLWRNIYENLIVHKNKRIIRRTI